MRKFDKSDWFALGVVVASLLCLAAVSLPAQTAADSSHYTAQNRHLDSIATAMTTLRKTCNAPLSKSTVRVACAQIDSARARLARGETALITPEVVVVNTAPTAAFTVACSVGICTLTTASTDAESATSLLQHVWLPDTIALPVASGPVVTYTQLGDSVDILLTVTDPSGLTDTITHKIPALPVVANTAPVASFTTACDSITCTLTSTSTDVETTLDSAATHWVPSGSSQVARYGLSTSFARENGAYIVTLTVTDAGGLTASAPGTIPALVVAAPAPSSVTLPTTFTVTYPTATRTTLVHSGDNLQTALNNAARGDELVLDCGATFTGNFTLPVKSGSGWIIVRSACLSSLPSGVRVSPSSAAYMAKIVTPNTAAAIATVASDSGWYLTGLEVTTTPLTLQSNGYEQLQFGIITLGVTQASLAVVPKNLVLDRMYIHGHSTSNNARCVALNSAYTAIINSYLYDCHAKGSDSQAIAGWNGPGPFKIVNNMLAGAGENVMFGGADPSITNLIPSDIEIRGNYIYTPPAWKNIGPDGTKIWTKKNLFELKNAQRVLVDGNVLDGSWGDGQVGVAIALKSSNQSGNCAWCLTKNVTIRNNRITHAAGLFNLVGKGNTNTVGENLNRVVIENNVADSISVGIYTGDPRFILLLNGITDITIRHNQFSTTASFSTFTTIQDSTVRNLAIENNIFSRGSYGLLADGGYVGAAALARAGGTKTFTNNTIIGASNGTYPATTVWVASLTAALSSAVSGVNRTTYNAAIAGVVP